MTWTRRRQTRVEQLQNKATNQLTEFARKGETINRFKIEHEAQKVEVVALKTELNGLEERLNALKERLVSLPGPLAEEARSGKLARDLNAGRGTSDERIGAARDGSDFSPGSQVAEPSIQAGPRASGYRFVSNGRRITRSVARFFIVALIGFGATFAWLSYGDGAKEVVRTWLSSLGSLLSVSTTKSPLDVDVAAKQTGPAPAGKMSAQDAALQQPAPVPQTAPAPAAAATSPEHSLEQLAAKQEQMSDTATLHAVEPDSKQNTSSPALQKGTQLTPMPETRPTTTEGWTLREVTNDDTAILEGPDGGIWSVKFGDTVPGLGKIESYVRANDRWTVATTSGPILMPVRQNASSSHLPETRPTTIEGWKLREVTNGAAVLEGPDGGIWTAKSGDTVPGLGKIDSIIRWTGQWIVATSMAYCKADTSGRRQCPLAMLIKHR